MGLNTPNKLLGFNEKNGILNHTCPLRWPYFFRLNILRWVLTHSAKGPWNKSLNFIFPIEYVIPKGLKVGHWLSEWHRHPQNSGKGKWWNPLWIERHTLFLSKKWRQVKSTKLTLHSLKLTAHTCQMKPFPKNDSVCFPRINFQVPLAVGFMERLTCFFQLPIY